MDGGLRAEDRRPGARDSAQRQPLQRPDVRRRDADDEEAARPRLCRAPHAVGAALRGDADEGRRRGASGALADRRVRRLRDLGQGQLRPEADRRRTCCPREYAREAYKRGLAYEAKLGANPFKFGMVGSTDSHTALADHRGGQLLRQGRAARAVRRPDPLRRSHHRPPRRRRAHQHLRAADERRPASRRCGRARTRAKRCGTRWRARRCTRRPARGCWCAFSPASISRRTISTARTSPSMATRTACRWAATSRPRPRARPRRS